jgi:CheY-like chemotaxis protein
VDAEKSKLKSAVLVVDDEKPYGKVMREILESYGVRVQVAYNASAAETLLKADTPDLILLDIMMPDKDGLTYLRELREDPRLASVPVIVASAHVTDKSRREALESGADVFLAKPITMADLKEAVSQFVTLA